MGIAIIVIVVLGAALYLFNPTQLLSEASMLITGWPSGDRIWDICRAIAQAEGFGVPLAAPTRNHNPGDISDGAGQFGYDPAVADSKVTSFPDDQTGWQWLYNKVNNIITGQSRVYGQDMSIEKIAQKWAGDWENWSNNVGSALGVDPTQTSFSDYVNGV